MRTPIEKFVYRGFSVIKTLGEIPKLDFKIEIDTVYHSNEKISHIYIDHLDCEVFLRSATNDEYVESYSKEGDLGTYIVNLGRLLLLEAESKPVIHLIVPLSSPKVDKFLEIKHKKKHLIFRMKISCYCLCYDSDYNLSEEVQIKDFPLQKMTTSGELSPNLIFNTDDFAKLMKAIKGYNLESIQIPIYDFGKQRFPSMKKAVSLLESAYQNLSSGNELATVRDIRNLFLNCLTVRKNVSTEDGTKPEKFLRDKIKKYIINKVPDNSKKVYGEVIKGLERNIRSICDVLSKFIHETEDILINIPLHKDLEFLYLSALSVVTYLAKLLE